jgi:hypothetical protein
MSDSFAWLRLSIEQCSCQCKVDIITLRRNPAVAGVFSNRKICARHLAQNSQSIAPDDDPQHPRPAQVASSAHFTEQAS